MALQVAGPRRRGGKDTDDADGVSIWTKPSGMGMAGTPNELPFCDARQLEVKDSMLSSLLARVRAGSPDPEAVEACELNIGHGETQDGAKEALAVTSLVEVATGTNLESSL
eukprot:5949825-Pleurochrysis_carterae.AAC.2